MIKEHLKGGNMKNLNSSSATDIIYIDHSNSSLEFGIIPDTTVPDSFSSIMKNNTLIIMEEFVDKKDENNDTKKPNPQLKPTA